MATSRSMRIRRAAAALVIALPLAGAACAPPPGPRNLLFVTLDTTRRDHLPIYGYPRDTAPRLTELASRAVVFDDAVTQETNTTPSHASMFTGVYPHEHGALDNGVRLPDLRPTLAAILREAGFRTGAFVSATPLKASASGLDRGFETYDDDFPEAVRDGRRTATAAIRWLRERGRGERWFCFLHLYEPHGPYLPPPPYRGLFKSDDPGPELTNIPPYQVIADGDRKPLTRLGAYVDLYDGEIRYADDILRAVLAKVDLRRTVVVVLSDHGEVLGGRHHVLDHGGETWEEAIRIPLVIHVPGTPPRRVAAPVETIDLLPTLATALGVTDPAATAGTGRNILLPETEMNRGVPRPQFAASRASSVRHADRGYRLSREHRIHAIRRDGVKLVRYPASVGEDYFELYDLVADPGETVNRVAERATEARSLRSLLDAWEGRATALPGAPAADPETLEQLRSLGYVGK